jgi:hypothetical protein
MKSVASVAEEELDIYHTCFNDIANCVLNVRTSVPPIHSEHDFFCRSSFVSNNERYPSRKNSSSSFTGVIFGNKLLTYLQPAVSFCFYDPKRAERYRNT